MSETEQTDFRVIRNEKTGERQIQIEGQWHPVTRTIRGPQGQRAYQVGDRWVADPRITARAKTTVLAPAIEGIVSDIAGSGILGIDYKSGVQHPRLRYELSRSSNDTEKEAVLDKYVGPGNYGKDPIGRYYVNPTGLAQLGIESEIPVSVSPALRRPSDIAIDLSGAAPQIAGALAFGAAAPATPLALGAIGLAGLGGAFGQAITEIDKFASGTQRVTGPGEVGGRLAEAGVEAGVGEAFGRGLMLMGRTALAPFASRVEPERKAMVENLMAEGYTPTLQQAMGQTGPMVQRQQGVSLQLFNNPATVHNIARATGEMRNLMRRAGSEAPEAEVSAILRGETRSLEQLGEEVKVGVDQAFKKFRANVAKAYTKVDATGGEKIIPSAPLKSVVQAIEERVGAAAEVLPPETRRFLATIRALPDQLSASEAQFLRSTFRNSAETRDLLKGVEEHFSGNFKRAMDLAFDEAAKAPGLPAQTVAALRNADKFYREGIQKFDAPVIDKIARDARYTGSVEPEAVLDTIWRPKRAGALRRVMTLLPPDKQQRVRAAAMEDLLTRVRGDAPDGVDLVLSGAPFRAQLDRFGRDMLETMFGKPLTDDLFKFADRMVFLTAKQTKHGSIAAAEQGMSFLRYFFPLVGRYYLGKAMAHPFFVRWMALGLGEGPKAMAAREVLAQLARTMMISTASGPGPAGQGAAPMPEAAEGSALDRLSNQIGEP